MKNKATGRSLIFSLLCVILLPVMTVFGCSKTSSVPVCELREISYGPYSENTMDISLPEGRTGSTPAVILVHGGAWTGGDKGDFSYLRGHFSKSGFAAFSLNYRLARTEGTGLKNILYDIDNAVSYVRNQSGVMTYSRDRLFLVGHSAGGHISVLYAFSGSREGSLRGVVSYCGLYDLVDPELESYLKRMDRKRIMSSGKTFDRIGFVTGPGRDARIAGSPQFLIRNIPVLLFSGKMDDIIPWTQSANLYKKMKELGYDSTLYVYPDMGHDISPYYGKIISITEEWMRERM